MAGKKVIAICLSGGEFEKDEDGNLFYIGGDAHAMEVDDEMTYDNFITEVAEMFNYSTMAMSIKYFLLDNKKTLISISNDKDLKRMIKFHGDCNTTDIYVMNEEVVTADVSSMPGSRSSRTSLSEDGIFVDAPASLGDDIFGDSSEPSLLLDANFDIGDDSNNVDALFDIPSDLPLPLLTYNGEKHVKAAQQWQNIITGVGQRFNSVHEFRESLRKYAIAHQFAFRYKKNDSHRVTVRCKVDSCPWRIHASRLSTTQLICIKKMDSAHTCEGTAVPTGHQATRSWVASVIKEKLKEVPNYKPRDIVEDIKNEYGIQLNYFQAWRGKEIAKEQLQGSYKEAYGQLPSLCDSIMETNPGSLATFTTKDDSSFHRLFVSFHASIYGFQHGCRPLLFLDSVTLNSKYQGTLLTATAADGNDGVFPVAFAVVDAETNDNWHWFLVQLKNALSTCRGITFVADREKGMKESIINIFQDQNVYHGYCLHYLSEKLVRDLKGQFSLEVKRLMIEDLFAAAYAGTPEGFQICAERIKNISVEAYNWINQNEPEHWANAFFPGARYNHLTSNFGDEFYGWVSEAHELPITQMVDAIRCKMMDVMYARRVESSQWLTRLTPFMEEKLKKESVHVHPHPVLISSGNKVEVHGDSIEVVDIDNFICSCKGWQLTGLPCCHTIPVIACLNRDPYDYCSVYFTAVNYRLTYSESVHPILIIDKAVNDSSQGALSVTVKAPPTLRPPGRPVTKKSKSIGKRQLQCGRCKGTGHNKSTCKELLGT
ncbi:hypothetical protein DCAR_0101906 [Daucus carota subsp. sativus]|uniref:SWIM-type domain-containing protein n=1 Tax=Daucus carota subsp. sativus TaxID=79200 RepID=A0AAF1AHB7_DAUCS|nr:PREDICTED: uncharacterized protein LOC108206358 [Daucus carota subsp. sativus]WOG82738.1 hypothetical protein DCAR_0101906 [Daucus carota subsp. sativus]